MGGTREGGLKAAAKLKAKDPDYFKKLRSKVKQPTGGKHAANGFDADPERARSAGTKGGRVSRRRKTADGDQEEAQVRDPEVSQNAADQAVDGRGDRTAGQGDQPTRRGGQA